MNTLLIAAFLITSSSIYAMAEQKPKKLECGERFELVRVTLDPEAYTGDFNKATGASITYQFSGVYPMVCTGFAKGNQYNITCAGYYHDEELTELKIRTKDSKVVALWRTSKGYGHIEMETECELIY